jgi:hypothetical protein
VSVSWKGDHSINGCNNTIESCFTRCIKQQFLSCHCMHQSYSCTIRTSLFWRKLKSNLRGDWNPFWRTFKSSFRAMMLYNTIILWLKLAIILTSKVSLPGKAWLIVQEYDWCIQWHERNCCFIHVCKIIFYITDYII